MKRMPLLFTLAALAAISQPVLAKTWQDDLRQFVIASNSGVGASANRPRQVAHRNRTVYFVPNKPKLPERDAAVTLDGLPLKAEAFIRKDRTYVGLVEFLEELKSRYGLWFDVQYEPGGKVTVRRLDKQVPSPISGQDEFGRALAYLWDGDVTAALTVLDRLAATDELKASDARELAGWLRRDQVNPVGVIRIAWWDFPADVDVFIDDEKVHRGAPLLTASAGIHLLRLVRADGREVNSQSFRVKPNAAFLVTLLSRHSTGTN